MAKIDLPYVQICRAKGRSYAYYRRGALRTRIDGEIGSSEFLAAYRDAHTQAEAQARTAPDAPKVVPGTLRALWLSYKTSSEWKALKRLTQVGYAQMIEPLLPRFGDAPISDMPPKWIQRRMDEMAPPRANHFLAVMRLLLNWSIPRGWIKTSPATGIKRAKHKPKSYRIWTDAEVAAMTGPGADQCGAPVARGA
jgi:hypothetical protein